MIAVLHVGQSETHVIEVFTSYWTGSDVITVDGQEVLRTKPFAMLLKWNQRLAFEVGESEKHTVAIVYSNPLSTGKAYVNGRLHTGCLFPQALAFNAYLWSIGAFFFTVLIVALMAWKTNQPSHYSLGVAALDKDDLSLALTHFNETLDRDPKDYEYDKRGIAYRKKGEYDKAIDDFTEALRLNPKFLSAHAHRGNAHFDKKDYDKALADYGEAYRLDPQDPHDYYVYGLYYYRNPYIGIAWLLATCPDDKVRDAKMAVTYATKACDFSDWKDPHCLNTLAAAHADAGQFKDAVQWQTKALELPGLSKEDQEKGRLRLKLYEEGKPYRDSKPYRF